MFVNDKIDVTRLKTDGTKTLFLKGKTDNYTVYRIPIDKLFYNDLNGRIVTDASRYVEEKGKKLSDISSKEEYNETISEFIINLDKDKFNATKNDIKEKSQIEPGVVTTDGRILDGNRRFTCLRQLYKETGNASYAYFRAAVIDLNNNDESDIARMELMLQFGIDEKADYDPIDKLVDLYNKVLIRGVLNQKTWCNITRKKPKEFEKLMERAKIMVDYLRYINKADSYYICKQQKLDGPFNELANLKIKDPELFEENKSFLYQILYSPIQGDLTRKIRSVINQIEKGSAETFKETWVSEYSRDILDSIDKKNDSFKPEKTDSNTYENVIGMQKLVEKIYLSYNQDKTKDTILDSLKDCYNKLNKIDPDSVSLLSEKDKKDVLSYLNKIISLANSLVNHDDI